MRCWERQGEVNDLATFDNKQYSRVLSPQSLESNKIAVFSIAWSWRWRCDAMRTGFDLFFWDFFCTQVLQTCAKYHMHPRERPTYTQRSCTRAASAGAFPNGSLKTCQSQSIPHTEYICWSISHNNYSLLRSHPRTTTNSHIIIKLFN